MNTRFRDDGVSPDYLLQVVVDLHNDIYRDELLGYSFHYIYYNVLEPKERLVLESKIEGLSNRKIARLLRNKQTHLPVKEATIKRHIRKIKSKYRNHMDVRIDNRMGLFDWLAKVKGDKRYEKKL